MMLLVIVFPVASAAVVHAAPETKAPLVRIGLMTQQFGILIDSNGPVDVVNIDNGKIVGEVAPGVKARLGLRDGQIVMNNTLAGADRLRIMPRGSKTIEREERYIVVNNRRYHGTVEVFRTPGKTGLTAVNVLPVDKYAYGLLVRDVAPEWPVEALKAQAVAARTYALFNIGRHKDEGFDLCATSDCQVYSGLPVEDLRAQKAIEDTRGLVITYQGQLIDAVFFPSSGGYTENSENVRLASVPYLRGVPDHDQTSPYFQWQKKFSPLELENILKDGGHDVGTLTAIEVSKRTQAPMKSVDRGISGRIKTMLFIGKNGVVILEGARVRELLSLQSTLFDFSVAVPITNLEHQITDSYGERDAKQIEIQLPPSTSGGLFTDREGIHRITGRKNETIFIEGSGMGSGLGLSLWGAKAMAEKAVNPESAYFQTILKHYYQGVSIDKWY